MSSAPTASSQPSSEPRSQVVLVHGLFMGRHAMLYLARRLKREGFRVRCFAHNTVTGSLERSASRLTTFVQRESSPVVLIGHSLGGLVSLQASQGLTPSSLKGVILLGSPYQGARAGEVLRRLLGAQSPKVARAIHEWSDLACKPVVPAPVYTLAGTRSKGLGRVLCGFKEPNDGTVTVAETRYPGAGSAVMPVSHTGMLFDRRVADRVVAWVRSLGGPKTSN